MKTLTRDEVIKLLRKRQGKRSLRELAAELSISAPYLSDIFLGRRGIGPAVLSQLGLEAVKSEIVYVRQQEEAAQA